MSVPDPLEADYADLLAALPETMAELYTAHGDGNADAWLAAISGYRDLDPYPENRSGLATLVGAMAETIGAYAAVHGAVAAAVTGSPEKCEPGVALALALLAAGVNGDPDGIAAALDPVDVVELHACLRSLCDLGHAIEPVVVAGLAAE